MAPNPWFKFYGAEYLSDPKIASLSAQERSCWITLLCLASLSTDPGTIEFLTIETLLTKSGIEFDPYQPEEWNMALGVMDKFVRMRMITKSDDGIIAICNWTKRQDSSMTAAERQAKYRENKKSNENVTGVITKVTLEKRREDKNNTISADKPREVRVDANGEEKPKRVSQAKYPNARAVFRLFPNYEAVLWNNNTTYLSAAQGLYEAKGMEELAEMMAWYQENRRRPYCPQFDTPHEWAEKYEAISRFFDKVS